MPKKHWDVKEQGKRNLNSMESCCTQRAWPLSPPTWLNGHGRDGSAVGLDDLGDLFHLNDFMVL